MGTYDGAIRCAAKRLGLSADDYVARRAAGLKYCWSCRKWISDQRFGLDAVRSDGLAGRCRECKNRRERELHYPGKNYRPRKLKAT